MEYVGEETTMEVGGAIIAVISMEEVSSTTEEGHPTVEVVMAISEVTTMGE
uniref:Uncharacterized protein n=1 Tax=Solanum tuberosum TaxID=4113 RepID=M1CF87_SOLTU